VLAVACCAAAILCLGAPAPCAERGGDLVRASGVKGGVVVHLGCGDGELTVALRAGKSYLVHGLDADAAKVAAARERVRKAGLYGPVSVGRLERPRLPYGENQVNLLVVSKPCGIALPDVLRVLVPRGVVLARKGVLAARDAKPKPEPCGLEGWVKYVKPRPANIDEWGHFLHDSGNNAVARDRVVGPPRRLQWIAGPGWSREHDATPSVFAPVTAGGRIFYFQENGPVSVLEERLPDKWSLVARDAFNGALLWERPVPGLYSSRVIWGHIPVHSQRRLVADGERVYVTPGLGRAVSVLDAASGKTLRTLAGTEHASEIVLCGGVLVLSIRKAGALDGKKASRDRKRYRPAFRGPRDAGQAIVAVRAATGKVLWRRPRGCMPLTLAARGRRVFCAEKERAVCLELEGGKELWTAPVSARTLVAHGEVVLTATERLRANRAVAITAFAADGGRQLWTVKGDCLPNFHVFYAPVDIFVARGLVWGLARRLEWNTKPGSGHLLGLDPRTGAVKSKIPMAGAFTTGHHVRCYKGKATENYLIFNKRGMEFVSLDPAVKVRQDHWVRGACRYGVMPANGLLYAPPHSCACYPGAQLRGFQALAPADANASAVPKETSSEGRLLKGPAYDRVAGSAFRVPGGDNWPTYRHDPARSGAARGAGPAKLAPLWSAKVGGRISALTAAGGKVFVAGVDAHEVVALDARSGRRLWGFTAGARVDSPPTVDGERLIFGCRDGRVYCLRARDGKPVWRFRAAPAARLVGADGQLESAWPVHGSVLVRKGVAYFAAGRSSFLDGGLHIFGLDAATGTVKHSMHIGAPDPAKSLALATHVRYPGAAPDVLSSDGPNLFMRHVKLDPSLSRKLGPADLMWGPKSPGHLLPRSGFLDSAMFNRSFWVFDHRSTRCDLLCFDGDSVYGVRVYSGISWNCPIQKVGEGFLITAQALRQPRKKAPSGAEGARPRPAGGAAPRAGDPAKKRKKKGRKPKGKPHAIPYKAFRWHRRLPARVRAMALARAPGSEEAATRKGAVGAGKVLFVAGPPDVIDEKDPHAAFEGRRGGRCWALSAGDGKVLAECELKSAPIFDGLIVAFGRVYISTTDGKVLCLGEAKK
jgi:outer membrane protein assembly factor BamB